MGRRRSHPPPWSRVPKQERERLSPELPCSLTTRSPSPPTRRPSIRSPISSSSQGNVEPSAAAFEKYLKLDGKIFETYKRHHFIIITISSMLAFLYQLMSDAVIFSKRQHDCCT